MHSTTPSRAATIKEVNVFFFMFGSLKKSLFHQTPVTAEKHLISFMHDPYRDLFPRVAVLLIQGDRVVTCSLDKTVA